ncbi:MULTISPECIES: TetR/AcrR family transcriptional regulator [unclassified Pseudarthrobacter]|uniref:TetR/AcrR family transcriptional regulator n=1 Tax=unclassified Pseudarthrobacter TaxID=2647000 RepID=UPI00113178EA|nr:TetR/AcrR family transcriptional regulator [Pseudarthrobacter sp. NIBRBAC000502772]QDG65070.1 TetR/AcrR family transcriptional regulator [Pseudarthrobacter sp. NIBRBAC000502772]
MSFIPLLPGSLSGPPAERSDAARNRERLLGAARELIAECGPDALTMDRLAERAGVGKGTVFRRFGSRAGLMMTLLSDSEAAFQARFMFGPPPLGPGAPGLERLIAFGAERIAYVMEHGDLARAAEASAHSRYEVPAVKLWQRHIELLLREEGMDADPLLMAMSLTATLDPDRLLHAVRVHGLAPERLTDSWRELVTRVVRGR